MRIRIKTKLLGVNSNPKTSKSVEYGYLTGILYLAPYKLSGVNLCPHAKQAGCWRTCLNTAGHGGIGKTKMTLNGITVPDNTVQRARLARTDFFNNFRQDFMEQLVEEISKLHARARRRGLKTAVRLNGTSDIQWENIKAYADGTMNIFEYLDNVQFYDYTKIPKRFTKSLPKNYYLCLSYSEASMKYADKCLDMQDDHDTSLVWVTTDKEGWLRILKDTENRPIVDGDEHDLRFLDPKGAMVVLKAKGAAKNETNGFVIH